MNSTTLESVKAKEQYCNNCGLEIVGRADKKFCDDSCRSAYNNQLNSASNNYIRIVNNALGKNRRILESLLYEVENSLKVSRDKLTIEGFNFKYQTHTRNTKTGKSYFYCYEYGYLPLDNDLYLIVKEKAE